MCLQGEPGATPTEDHNRVKALAKVLHESTRGHVTQFREWDQLDAEFAGQKVFKAQAGALLESYVILPLEDTTACSGCRTCTEALDRLDCARRDFIAVLEEARMLRAALVGLVGSSDRAELEMMLEMTPDVAAVLGKPAKLEVTRAAIKALLKAVHSVPTDPVEVDRTHEECAYCAHETVYPPVCKGHSAGPIACTGFQGAEVC